MTVELRKNCPIVKLCGNLIQSSAAKSESLYQHVEMNNTFGPNKKNVDVSMLNALYDGWVRYSHTVAIPGSKSNCLVLLLKSEEAYSAGPSEYPWTTCTL